MNWEVFVTCAVTGAGDTVSRSELVPVTPEQIADSAIEAARAGAAIAHIHVRDPETGRRATAQARFYREVVERIRASDVDPVLNLTAGMGGDLILGDDAPMPPGPPARTWCRRWRVSSTSRRCCPRCAPSTAAR